MIASLGLLTACGGGGSSDGAASADASGVGTSTNAQAGSQATGSQATGLDGSSSGTQAPSSDGSDPASGSSPQPVQSAQSSAVTLSWQPPTENTDGTALTGLTGYTIHYGVQSGDYTSSIQLTNPGLTTYVVDNLAPGTYYFAITASAADGAQSDYSSEVAATVN